MPSASAPPSVCADCAQTVVDLIEVRRRYLCSSCLSKYIASKILKRMESYRFKNQVGEHRRKLLLPLSGGVSSLVLLHVLDAQLQRQMEKQGRTAYDLILVHVRVDEPVEHVEAWREVVMRQIPGHEFLPVIYLGDIASHDVAIEEDLQAVGLAGNNKGDLIAQLFAATKTPTARSDLQELLLQRVLIAVAKETNCESTLWAHSDSRLAAKALADIAKGRGGAVANALSDGPSPWGINFNYPVRDLYETELELYVQHQADGLSKCLLKHTNVPEAPVSVRHTSIDALLTGYITSQGEKYPSIMANVVRTTGKLQPSSIHGSQKCQLCRMPCTDTSENIRLCYGCSRMKQDIKI